MKFAPFTQPLSYADIPIAYVLELGGEEFLGIRDTGGNFQQIESLDEVPKDDWQQVETFGPGLGLLVPCLAHITNDSGDRIGGLSIRIIHGKPACMQIYSLEGITSSMLRQLPLTRLVHEAVSTSTVRIMETDTMLFGARYVEGGPGFGELHEDLRRELATVGERARRRVVDRPFLTEVAKIYRAAYNSGLPPARAVEDVFGPCTPTTARRWIAAARREGLLGPAPARGRAGETTHELSVSS